MSLKSERSQSAIRIKLRYDTLRSLILRDTVEITERRYPLGRMSIRKIVVVNWEVENIAKALGDKKAIRRVAAEYNALDKKALAKITAQREQIKHWHESVDATVRMIGELESARVFAVTITAQTPEEIRAVRATPSEGRIFTALAKLGFDVDKFKKLLPKY